MVATKTKFFLPVLGLTGLAGVVATVVKLKRDKQRQLDRNNAQYEEKLKAALEAEKRRLTELEQGRIAKAEAEQRRRQAEEEEAAQRRAAKKQRLIVKAEAQARAELQRKQKAAEEYAAAVAAEEAARRKQREEEVAAEQRRIAEAEQKRIAAAEARRERLGTYFLVRDLKELKIVDSKKCNQFQDFQIKFETEKERKARTAPFRQPDGSLRFEEGQDEPEPKTLVAKGGFGSVWLACRAADCQKGEYKYVGKRQNLFGQLTPADFIREAIIAKYASDKGFGVPVVTYFRCNKGDHGVIIMKLMKPLPQQASSDAKLIDTMSLKDFKQVLHKIDDMHEHGILHKDLYAKNLVRDPETSQLLIADFGLAEVSLDPVPLLRRASEVVGLILGDSRPSLKIGTAKFQAQALAEYRKILNNDEIFSRAQDAVAARQAYTQAMYDI